MRLLERYWDNLVYNPINVLMTHVWVSFSSVPHIAISLLSKCLMETEMSRKIAGINSRKKKWRWSWLTERTIKLLAKTNCSLNRGCLSTSCQRVLQLEGLTRLITGSGFSRHHGQKDLSSLQEWKSQQKHLCHYHLQTRWQYCSLPKAYSESTQNLLPHFQGW